MKILVLRLSSMGDCVLATALFSYLKRRYENAAVTFVTGSAYAPLFSDDPRLAAVTGIASNASTLPADVTGQEWDLVADLQNSRRSRALLHGVRSKQPAGRFDKKHCARFLLIAFRIDCYDPSLHVAARYLQAAGGDPHSEEVPPPLLFFSDEGRRRAATALNARFGAGKRPMLALFPFSAWKNKEWPAAYFETIGRHFLEKGWNVALMGGPQDGARAEALRARTGARCVSLAGTLSLYESGCMLTGFDLALGNDTGLTHLARACGVKTGILYGPTTRHFGFSPYGGPLSRVFEERLFCRPCHAHGGNVCWRRGRRCLRRIGPETVINGLEKLFNAPPPADKY
jgi:heptosyltransferase-2